jgi:acyl-CoA hydrolase
MEYEKGLKKVEDSKTEWMKCIQYEDINGVGRLFGGRLLQWMDEVAGIAAIRHAGIQVTTAAVDNLVFKRGAYINDIVLVESRVTYVGRSSMEVRVDVYIEDKETGMRSPINRAYFTEVCIDEAGKSIPVPYGLEPETEAYKAEYEGAKKRIEMRKHRKREGF